MISAYEYLRDGGAEYFSADEWPVPEDLKFVDYKVIMKLDELRHNFGEAIYPSQLPEGLVRRTGSRTSRHYIGDGSFSLAVDVFPSERSLDCWLKAIEMSEWRGIGIYLDTKILRLQPGPMLHLDIDTNRPQRTLWARDGEYIVKDNDPTLFWKKMYESSKI